MRKPTRNSLKRGLDKVFSQIVRKRKKCERCGKQPVQCCHIFGRRYLNTRWLLDNALALCSDCHINFAHQKPILFAEFVKKLLGEDKYELLKEAHNQIYKPTLEDLQIKLKVLQENGRK